MELVADNVWQSDFQLSSALSDFKFAYSNWGIDWGETNQTQFVPPIFGTAEQAPGWGKNILISNAAPGFYRFSFNSATLEYSITLLYTNDSHLSVIKNNGFETQGSSSMEAYHWEWNNPTNQGARWGRGQRANWRSHSGGWEGAFWSKEGDTDYGGWWQEGPAEAGQTYEGSAWFFADANSEATWTAVEQIIKLEFYDTNFVLLSDAALDFHDIEETWKRKKVQAVAPTHTAWGRIVLAASGVGTKGSLQFDDIQLVRAATRSQDFNDWIGAINDGTYDRDNWILSEGKTTTTNARSGYAATLANPSGVSTGGFIQSPIFDEGVGVLHFWYRHSATNEDDIAVPLNLSIQTSEDGSNWTNAGQIEAIANTIYKEYSQYIYLPSRSGIRIQHAGGTDRVLIDDISIDLPAETPRFMHFNTWPDSSTNLGTNTYFDWTVEMGIVDTNVAYDGKSAKLPGTNGHTNFMCTPLFDGYGTISFRYARGTNGLAPASLILQTSVDKTNWITISAVSNIMSASYETFSQYFYNSNTVYLRIANISQAVNELLPLIDEGFNNGASPPPGWVFTYVTTIYETQENSGRQPPSLKFDSSGDVVKTPALDHPTNLSFWIKGVSTGANTNSFSVEQAVEGTWLTITNISPLPTISSGTVYSLKLNTSATNIKFSYNKIYGNAAFDDVIITGVANPDQPAQWLMLDDISIGDAKLVRLQNFDSWPIQSGYGNSEFEGWQIVNAYIGPENAYYGQAARMNAASGNYIQSPLLPGVGPISFQYRHWDGNTPSVNAQVLLSTNNGMSWSNLASITISSTNYHLFSYYLYETNPAIVRIYHNSGSERSLFDEINCATPQPPADVLINAWHQPDKPYTNDEVYLYASTLSRYGAGVTSMVSYYRIGTSGLFSALNMEPHGTAIYRSEIPISPQPTGTIVQYYTKCQFGGPGASLNSPRYHPTGGSTTNPAWFGIPRARPGQVWINEIKYLQLFTENEFVELAGPAGFNLGDWRIEFASGSVDPTNVYYVTPYARYDITPSTFLPNHTNGYGFWVLGQSGVTPRDMLFTNSMTAHLPTGIRLINEMNGIEYAVSVDGTMLLYERIPVSDNDWYPAEAGIDLMGTGWNYTNFTWTTNLSTPGSINVNQTLIAQDEPIPEPIVDIIHILLGTNIVITTYGNTNVPPWSVTPLYSTNLLPNHSLWMEVTVAGKTNSAGYDTLWFQRPSGANYFYRIGLAPP